uniref:Putative E3 ubiquitin-protein ligase HERC3 n=1 Tax=Lygus hesperus TaxID=30085 RepID=A0A0A9WUV1_LYGHE
MNRNSRSRHANKVESNKMLNFMNASSNGSSNTLRGIAGRTIMLVGHGERLASVTNAFTVRPLSILSTAVRSMIPSRRVRFMDLGYGDEIYMVGVDSTLYKATASKRSVGTPRRVMSLCHMPISRVSCGSGFIVLIDQHGRLLTMGNNKVGQLGIGKRGDARRSPYIHQDLRRHFFTQIAAGDRHALALTSSGVVYGSGSNEFGQLGLGESTDSVTMFSTLPIPYKVVGIAAGPAGSMFACENGSVYVCGHNDCKQLGVDTNQRRVYTPTRIPLFEEGVVSYVMDFGGFRRSERSV